MKWRILGFLLLVPLLLGQTTVPQLRVEDGNASPRVDSVTTIKVTEGTLTDNGVVNGRKQVTIDTGGGGGGASYNPTTSDVTLGVGFNVNFDTVTLTPIIDDWQPKHAAVLEETILPFGYPFVCSLAPTVACSEDYQCSGGQGTCVPNVVSGGMPGLSDTTYRRCGDVGTGGIYGLSNPETTNWMSVDSLILEGWNLSTHCATPENTTRPGWRRHQEYLFHPTPSANQFEENIDLFPIGWPTIPNWRPWASGWDINSNTYFWSWQATSAGPALVLNAGGLTWNGLPVATGSFAPTTANYLVGTAQAGLSAEIVVGTAPGGELGGTWVSPSVDDGLTVDAWTLTNPTITCTDCLGSTQVGALAAGDTTTGTFTDALIPAAITRDAEAAAAYQPLDSDLTDLADGTLSQSRGGTGAGALTCASDQRLTSDGTAYSCSTLPAGGGGGSITIGEQDLAPSVTASVLRFDQNDGLVVTEPVAGTARVDFFPNFNYATGTAPGGVSVAGDNASDYFLDGQLEQARGGTGAINLTCAADQRLTSNGTSYSCSTLPAGGGGSGINVGEVDLAPVVNSVTTLHFDQADGFTVAETAAGTAKVDYVENVQLVLGAAGCVGNVSTLLWDSPTAGFPAAPPISTCLTGTVQRAAAIYAGNVVNEMEQTFPLPSDWVGSITATVRWMTVSPTSGNVGWYARTLCRAVGEAWNTGSLTTTNFPNDAVDSANVLNETSLTTITTTGCAAGEDLTLTIGRGGDTDSNNDLAHLFSVTLRLNRNAS